MPLSHTTTPLPQNFFVVYYHGHQLLDSAGPLDILATVAKHAQGQNFTLTNLAEDTGPVNLAAIPPRGATWRFEQPQQQPSSAAAAAAVNTRFNPQTIVDVTFAAALASLRRTGGVDVEVWDEHSGSYAVENRSVDVLLIPGGIGSRLYRVDARTGERGLNVQGAVDFARTVCGEGFVRCALMTVCTGSDLLAHTGLLEGRRATTNANAFEEVAGRHGGVAWLKGRRWVRSVPGEEMGKGKGEGFDKEIWTSAGISAGMDLMLWFLAEVYGVEFARGIARKIEYEWREGIREGEVDPYYST